jgi:hypothetical protein
MPDAPDESVEPLAVELLGDDGVAPMPVEPIPVEPIPVEALPVEPLPVGAIPPEATYSWPQRLGPPRLVIAIGVWSIVVASLGLIGGPVSALTLAAVVAARTSPAVVAPVTAPAALAAPVTEVVDPDGFSASDRAAAIEGLSRVRQMTQGQQSQLDELLAEFGHALFSTGSPVDPAVVAASVTTSGQLGTLDTAAADSATTYFVLANGRLELTDTRAVFFPGPGQPSLHAVAYVLPDLPADATTAPPLSDDAIRSTMRTIARMNGSRPKAAQVQAMLTLLRGSAQQVVLPTKDGSDPATEVANAMSDPDGTLTVLTAHAGTSCTVTVTTAGQVSASLATPNAAAVGPPPNSAALGFVVILSAVELAIAIYLLVIGILTVRRSRLGRVLHWIYVGVKLPVAVGVVVAMTMLGSSISGAGTSGWWVAGASIGLIYPTVLIFALFARTVREYYGSADAVTSGGTRSAPW